MQKVFTLFCAECGSSDLDIGYFEDPGGPLVFETECNLCGATGRLEGLSMASLRLRVEKVDELTLAAVMAKHLAVGKAAPPTDEEILRWVQEDPDPETGELREATDINIQAAREFLEGFPEALAVERNRANRAKVSAKRAEFKRINARTKKKHKQNEGDND